MIETLTVSNYRSLGEGVRIDLEDFTALVGPNGAGKSNVVDVLRFVSDAMSIGLSGAITSREGIKAVRRWSGGHPFNLSIDLQLRLPHGAASYRFELAGDRVDEYRVKVEEAQVVSGSDCHRFVVSGGSWRQGPAGLQPQLDPQTLALPLVGGDTRFQALVSALRRTSVYSIFPDTLRAPQKYDPTLPMKRHGSNWASVLKEQPQETWKPELVEALRRLTGDVEDIRVKTAAGYLVTEFRHTSPARAKTQKWFAAAQESDGTLRVAGIIMALLQEPPLPVVGLEEPELTVHPGAIRLLVDYLKQAAKRSQVIITTHSPELLDLLKAEQIRVVTREAGATRVDAMREDQRDAVRAGLLSLGELLTLGDLHEQELLPLETV
jgi:predicted ATPase